MEYTRLIQLQPDAPVDSVIGMIKQVDLPSPPIPSRIQGQQPQTCQDVVIELEDRSQVAIAFWDLNSKCFGMDGRREQLAFTREHEGKWIEVMNREVKGKPSFRRLKSRSHAARGGQKAKLDANWEARGIHVYLKATSGCTVRWLVNEGENTPRIGPPQRVKTKRRLEAPGRSRPQGGETPMSNDVPGRRSNQNQPPAGKQSQPPADQKEQAADKKPAQPTPQQWRRRASKLNAAAHCRCLAALRELYIKANVQVSDGFLVEAAKTLHIQLTQFRGPLQAANLTLLSAKPDQIKWAIGELAQVYFDAHQDTVEQLKAANEPSMEDEICLRSHVTTNFISTINTYPIILPR